jgi:DNA-binding response OmpR family regulator
VTAGSHRTNANARTSKSAISEFVSVYLLTIVKAAGDRMTQELSPPTTIGEPDDTGRIAEGEQIMRIAIADDDATVRHHIQSLLHNRGYACSTFSSGEEMVTALQRDTFDLLIVDWNMPGLSGLDVLEWLGENAVVRPSVIMMTNRADKADIVRGLDAGADDYIVKPEEDKIILARVEARLRDWKAADADLRTVSFGTYVFDKLENSVLVAGERVDLTAKEFALARAFFENKHRPLSRAYILETIWNSVGDLPTRTLDVHVSRLRNKLKLKPENGFRLHTIFGFGYRLESFDEAA